MSFYNKNTPMKWAFLVEMAYGTMPVAYLVGSTMDDGIVDVCFGCASSFGEREPLGQLGSKGT